MPTRIKSYCLNGCKEKSVSGSQLCPKCFDIRQKRIDKRRNELAAIRRKKFGTSNEQGYDWKWAKVSKLVRRQEPICRHCKDKLAEMVDHIVPLRQGGERLALDNLQPLCNKCHGIKTEADKVKFNSTR